MSRIGFFAGSFDPIHDGHIEVAKSAIKELELDSLYLMVEEKPWGTKNPISLIHRQKILDIAIEKYNKISQLQLPDKQFNINKTLIILENKFPNSELYFIFGADVFMLMNNKNWPGLANLLEHYIVVFERKKITEKEITEHAKSLGIVVAIIPSKYNEHSSTDVRLNPANKNIWVPKNVAEYIDINNLYKVSDSKPE